MNKITAGVDTKENPALTSHEQMMTFFTMRQEMMEVYDYYLNMSNSRLNKMEMYGG